MARTRDPVAHAVRREAFLDAATRLIIVKGYEQLSIQDVLDAVPASKGAFYHYFGSKNDLLEAVVLRMVEEGFRVLEPAVADPGLTALEKLEALFAGLAAVKEGQKELILGFLAGWMSDDNIVVRERFRRITQLRMIPLLTGIIEQGMGEGSFAVSAAARTARAFAAMFLATNEAAGDLLTSWQTGEITFEDVVDTLTGYGEALERVLGAAPGALGFERRTAVVREWFDAAAHSPRSTT